MIVVDVCLTIVAVILLVPSSVYALECLVAVVSGDRERSGKAEGCPQIAVVVPAHNEEGLIGETVAHLKSQLPPRAHLVVIADNCDDETAQEASSAGAAVWERNNTEQRGKGYAISFALDRLADSPPDIVVLIDADCKVSDGLLEEIATLAAIHERPVQAKYLFKSPLDSGRLTQVSAFACLVRNYVRPLGMRCFDWPCHLTGSGMAFLWSQIRNAPAQHGNIVEDLSLGLDLAISGHEPLLCTGATVCSELPQSQAAAESQRRRWEHGQIATLIKYTPRLILEAFRQNRPALLGLAVDLAVPPLALLVLLNSFAALASWIAFYFGATSLPLAINVVSLASVFSATVLAWARFGRNTMPASTLLAAPAYILWKLPLYLAVLFRKTQKEWVRTDRESEG